MLFKNAALFLGLAGSAAAQSGPSFDPIAGYLPRTDQTGPAGQLDKDLIQRDLEFAIVSPPGPTGIEDCVGFANADPFLNTAPGNYLRTLPTYFATESEPYNEMNTYYCSDPDPSNNQNFCQKWVKKAYQRRNFNACRGSALFADAFIPPSNPPQDCIGFEEVLKKGLSYGCFLVESYQLMQKAIDFAAGTCVAQDNTPLLGSPPCFDAVEAWDAAAAAYVGSLEGTDGNNAAGGDYGKAPYALGDKRCRNFGQCGPDNGATYNIAAAPKDITAPANNRIMALFAAGSHAAWVGDYRLMKGYLRLISNKSAIPLIQGTFRYYYRLDDLEFPGTWSTSDKELAEGAAFVMPILPKVWACSKKAEQKLYAEAKVDINSQTAPIAFIKIQLAIECNYRCLGITCAEVGELYDGGTSPKPGFVGCDDEPNGSDTRCAKQTGARKSLCKMYTGSPGIKDRNKLKFEF